MTTLERTEKVPPLEKFNLLANEIDHLRQKFSQLSGEQNFDDLIEVLELPDLCERFQVTEETMKKRLVNAGGQVFKMGKKHVIRKVKFLEVLENLESGI